jgi:COP9 signalosome complex subunit 5
MFLCLILLRYHSHPFDLADHGHCFLSQTDLSTELQWQRAEDPHGNPFVAIVVDPLRSFHLQKPEIKAFRAYPPEYNSPVHNECPDGSIQPIEQFRLEQWGSCWNRYYELEVYVKHGQDYGCFKYKFVTIN